MSRIAAIALWLAACGRIDFAARTDAGPGDGATFTGLADLVQTSLSLAPSGATVGAPYLASQHAGDLNVVMIGGTGAAIASVTDTSGNAYTAALPATTVAGLMQAVYYAPNIADAAPGANTVTVTLTTVPTSIDLRILEYSGLATSDPIDIAQSASGNDASDPTVAITTTAPDLIVAATIVGDTCISVGRGYRVAVFDDYGDTATDLDAPTPGTYSAGCHAKSSQPWIAQAVAFRTVPGAQRSPITLRQTGEDESGNGIMYLYGDQLAGDTVFVVVAWAEPGSAIGAITDTAGNTFTPIAGFPVAFESGAIAFAPYYARDIVGLSDFDQITVTFDPPLPAGTYAGVYAVELAGVDRTSPFDADTYQICTNTTSCASGLLATSFAPEIMLTTEILLDTPDLYLPGPGTKLVYFNSSSSGSTTGTVLQYETAAGPGSFETSYSGSDTNDFVQSLFAFH